MSSSNTASDQLGSIVTAKFCPPGICSRILLGGILAMISTVALVFVVAAANLIEDFSRLGMYHNVLLHGFNMTIHIYIILHCFIGILGLFIYHKILIRFFTVYCSVGLTIFFVYVFCIDFEWFLGHMKTQITNDFGKFYESYINEATTGNKSSIGVKKMVMDRIQTSYGCCGSKNVHEYAESNLPVPESCGNFTDGCMVQLNYSEEMARGFVSLEFVAWFILYNLLYFGLSLSQDPRPAKIKAMAAKST